jgi:glucose/arabinose dehydrogenase
MSKKNKLINLIILALIAVLILAFGFRNRIKLWFFSPTETEIEENVNLEELSEVNQKLENQAENSNNQIKNNQQNDQEPTQIMAKNLEIPWEIVFLKDGSLLVTERPGNLVRIKPDSQEKIEIKGVEHVGEGGLLGMALHPDFKNNRRLYLYLTTKNNNRLINRVESYQFDLTNNSLNDKQEIISNIPGAVYHDGGRIAFGPDGYLYITTGDATEENLAQDQNSLAGKILRLNPNGTLPKDNPFNNAVYSLGHRNPQGLAWDKEDQLWATEHGPSGLSSGQDEVNLIEKGQNYGWPIIKGDQNRQGLVTPVIQSTAQETWAPAGCAILGNTLYFTGLRGASLYQAKIQNEELINLKTNFKDDFGRLRMVKIGPDGWLYLATSNRDGRGSVQENDDKIIKINPATLN